MSNDVTDRTSEEGSTSLMSSFFSFVLPTAHADAKPDEKDEDKDDGKSDDKGKKDDNDDKEDKDEKEDDGGDDKEEKKDDKGGDEEEEEEEPEDIAPGIRQECEDNQCATAAKHFHHCQEKVEAGEGWQGEDCIEEMFHMLHCVDTCAAGTLFRKLA